MPHRHHGIVQAKTVAGFDKKREPSTVDIAAVLSDTVPLAKLMAEPIAALRKWAQGRARPASVATSSRGRRIAA